MKTLIQTKEMKTAHKKQDLALVRRLSERIRHKFGPLVISILMDEPRLFHNPNMDESLTVYVILDDLSNDLNETAINHYLTQTKKFIAETSSRITVKNLRMTEVWDGINEKNPKFTEMLRNARSLHDKGFFMPLQELLFTGKIKPTYEAMNIYFARTQTTLRNANSHMLQSAVDLYWAAIDAAHALLMQETLLPPSPSHVPELMQRELVSKNIISTGDVKLVKEMVDVYKSINRKELQRIDGHTLDVYTKRVEIFVDRVHKRLLQGQGLSMARHLP